MNENTSGNREITRSAIQGSISFMILAWFSTGINFIINIILARILFPEDFGISSISFTIVGIFSMFLGFGVGPGVIHSKADKEKLFSTFFFLEMITTILFSLLVFSLSRPFATFFLDIRLESTLQVLIIYVILSGINSIPKTYLLKETQFRKITIIETISILVNLVVSLSLVLLGFGF